MSCVKEVRVPSRFENIYWDIKNSTRYFFERFQKSSCYNHAKKEFEFLENSYDRSKPDERPLVLDYQKEILSLVDKFGKSGQSGGSAPFTAGAITSAVKNICAYEPLSPINDIESEWTLLDYGDDIHYQHKRLSSVFKNIDGTCHYIDAIVFQGEDKWDTFSGRIETVTSSLNIKSFPFTKKTFYIDVVRERNDTHPDRISCGDGDYFYKIKDWTQVEEAYKYYLPPKSVV